MKLLNKQEWKKMNLFINLERETLRKMEQSQLVINLFKPQNSCSCVYVCFKNAFHKRNTKKEKLKKKLVRLQSWLGLLPNCRVAKFMWSCVSCEWKDQMEGFQDRD